MLQRHLEQSGIHLKITKGSIWLLTDEEQAVASKHALHTDRCLYEDRHQGHLYKALITCVRKTWKSNESIKLHKTKDGSYRIAISVGHTQTHKPNQKHNAFTMGTFCKALITCFRNS